ncbi:MAG: hypothetical protein CVT92_13525 [Bacteroidetes bacterium HGW-Bacteroidetes-1]|jgi:8-oxo-dGTP pyrophosphatase MutT (NUDIX family)|nr:MAG: hypothetical protein CVT92_13525 [Bacteroidetes bacterium HGW-Bacteroidetes-1]
MYKVFCDNRCLQLINPDDRHLNYPEMKISQQADISSLVLMINDWINGKIAEDISVTTDEDPYQFFYRLLPSMSIVEAAGGVVKNRHEETLFIFRNNFWDLPKGHRERGETLVQTAVREVEEETGLSELTVVQALPDTWHCYQLHGKWHLKYTAWFVMSSKLDEKLCPQLSEGIIKAEWIKPENMSAVLRQCYRSVQDILGSMLNTNNNDQKKLTLLS